MTLQTPPQEWIGPLLQLARQAGATILAEQSANQAVIAKPDGSPQTSADRAAEAVIISGLRALAPFPVVAEESSGAIGPYDPARPYWLVDPLDGTRSFVAGHDDYSVNIALLLGGRPAFGVIYAPARAELFWSDGKSAWYQQGETPTPIHSRPAPPEGLTMITGRRTHAGQRLQSIIAQEKVTSQLLLSSALKFGYVAMGRADIYPRFSNTMEWDNAAGEVILTAAGGSVTAADGRPLAYGQPDLTHQGLIARGFKP